MLSNERLPGRSIYSMLNYNNPKESHYEKKLLQHYWLHTRLSVREFSRQGAGMRCSKAHVISGPQLWGRHTRGVAVFS